MRTGSLFGLAAQNLRRSRRAFLFSVFGISIGIASLVFFLALSSGVRQVLRRVFPASQLEVIPARSSLGTQTGLDLFGLGGAKPLDDVFARELRSEPEVAGVFPRMKLAFPGRAWGGAQLFGRNIYTELIAEGIDSNAMAGESLGPEPFSDDLGSQKACQTDPDCVAPEYCPWDTRKCERPIPATISPFILELYNGVLAPSHGLPKIGDFLASKFRGFGFNIELGRSFIGGASPTATAAPPTQRRVMLVGISPRASQLAVTLPLGFVRRFNAAYAGEKSAAAFSSVLVELKANQGAAAATRIAALARVRGFELADSGAERASLAVTLITALFALISLSIVLLATVNIAHSFFRQVAERKREIGVLRSVGASASDIRKLIVVEAAAIGLAGGVVGILLARLLGFGVDLAARSFAPDFPFRPSSYFSFDLAIVLGALGCAVVACVVGGYFPARRAAALDPAEALTS